MSEIKKVDEALARINAPLDGLIDKTKYTPVRVKSMGGGKKEKQKEESDNKEYLIQNIGEESKEMFDSLAELGFVPVMKLVNEFHPKVKIGERVKEIKSTLIHKYVFTDSGGLTYDRLIEYFAMTYAKKYVNIVGRVQLLITAVSKYNYSTRSMGRHIYKTSLLRPKKVNLKNILDRLKKKASHYEPDKLDKEYLAIIVREVRTPRGNGRTIERSSKYTISPPFNEYCGQACLSLFLMRDTNSYKNWQKPGRGHGPWLKSAKQLGLDIGHKQSEMKIHDFKKFSDVKNIRVVIYDENRTVLYKYGNVGDLCPLLLSDNDHYKFITHLLSFLKVGYTAKNYKLCEYCLKIYRPNKNVNGHKCKEAESCPTNQCNYKYINYDDKLRHHAIKEESRCEFCNCKFFYRDCKIIHEKLCNNDLWTCPDCNKEVNKTRFDEEEHVCGEKYCKSCDIMLFPDEIEGHRCYLKNIKKPRGKITHWAFDIETTTDNDGNHIISIIVVKKLYTNDEFIFTDFHDFHKFMTKIIETNKLHNLWAHNAKGFDSYLIFIELNQKYNMVPDNIIRKGRKIMAMKYKNLQFLDSMNHLPGSLVSQIKTFDLKDNDGNPISGKDYFPYSFYTEENRRRIGPIPPMSEFNCANCDECCSYDKCSDKTTLLRNKKLIYRNRVLDRDEMNDAQIEEADSIEKDIIYKVRNGETCCCKHWRKWYNDNKNETFDFEEMATEYCRNDVYILAKALESYKDLAESITGIDPLSKITIASYSLAYYRYAHMPANSIIKPSREEYNFARRSLQGGRTNSLGFYHKGPMRYIDIVSLYPSVQLGSRYPIGGPIIKMGEDTDLDETIKLIESGELYGFVECDIIPPKNLYHPLLLVQKDGKLVESLLDEDFIKTVYTTVELQKAIKIL